MKYFNRMERYTRRNYWITLNNRTDLFLSMISGRNNKTIRIANLNMKKIVNIIDPYLDNKILDIL
jgi:hypothetical protein